MLTKCPTDADRVRYENKLLREGVMAKLSAEKKFLSELRRRLRWIDQNLKDGNVLDESSAHHISEIIDLVEIYITDEHIVL